MNMPAIVNQPGAEALKALMGEVLDANSNKFSEMVLGLCGRLDQLIKSGALTTTESHASCPAGGCSGQQPCTDCATKATPALGAYGDAWTQMVGFMQVKGCGVFCRPLNPCLVWALQEMMGRVSLRRLYWMMEKDDESVELNVNAGGQGYVNILAVPMVSNQTSLLAMSGSQMLPFSPAVTKATANWTGDPVITNVTLTLFQGPKGLTGLTPAQAEAQLLQLGNPKSLARWFCTAPNGSDGNCFVRPWPPFLGCSGGIIPDTEAIYLKIQTGELGDSTLKGLSLEVIKAGTSDSIKYCKQCDVPTDQWGMPLKLGPWA